MSLFFFSDESDNNIAQKKEKMMRQLFVVVACLSRVGVRAFSVVPQQQQSRRACRLFAWGAEPTWSPVEVLSNKQCGDDLYEMFVEVSESQAKAFEKPGQFVQLKSGDNKPGFFAIASPPTSEKSEKSIFEFLVKKTDSNDWLVGAKEGSALDMSEVIGKGYDLSQWQGDMGEVNQNYDGFACMNYLFLAQGTGIAPIRATIEAGAALELPKPATLYYGARDSKHAAYHAKYDAWLKDYNVKVVEIHSKPESDWTGKTGYVQDVLKADGIEVPRNAGAIVCGNKDFFTENKELLLKAGVFEGRILTNI